MGENVVNTGEYSGQVGPGESHVMLGIDTDQSRSTGHPWRPANVGSAQWNLLQSSSCCLQVRSLKPPRDKAGGFPGKVPVYGTKFHYRRNLVRWMVELTACISFKNVAPYGIYDMFIKMDENKQLVLTKSQASSWKWAQHLLLDSFLNNLSVWSCKFLDILKHAEVAPLFKGIDERLKENNRPISILISASKIFDKVFNW